MFRNKISTGGIWCQSYRNSPEKLTPLLVSPAITRWYRSPSPLEKECPTFRPSAPTLPTIRPASFAWLNAGRLTIDGFPVSLSNQSAYVYAIAGSNAK